jgi:transcriptional regulator with XRE-family HTH domain
MILPLRAAQMIVSGHFTFAGPPNVTTIRQPNRLLAGVDCLRQLGYHDEGKHASRCKYMASRFGDRVRELRKAKNLGQRALAQMIGVSHTYVSKFENKKLDFGDYPSEELIGKIAKALDADEDELLMLAEKIPERIKRRVVERPDIFRTLASLDDATLVRLLANLNRCD